MEKAGEQLANSTHYVNDALDTNNIFSDATRTTEKIAGLIRVEEIEKEKNENENEKALQNYYHDRAEKTTEEDQLSGGRRKSKKVKKSKEPKKPKRSRRGKKQIKKTKKYKKRSNKNRSNKNRSNKKVIKK